MVSEILKTLAGLVERGLDETLPRGGEVARCMRYAALGGGKRLRPAMLLEFCRIWGGDPGDALPFALALEMIHTYSLIHDDLPAMDDDDTRRGRPSSHIAFGEATALLAGDALLTLAFETAAGCSLPPKNVVKAIAILANLAGTDGMVGGQEMDLAAEREQKPISYITEMYRKKTGALLAATAKIPAALFSVGGETARAAEEYCEKLGLLFQITDDILDLTGDPSETGKPVGSDEAAGKSTYPAAAGIGAAREEISRLRSETEALAGKFGGDGFFRELPGLIAGRRA